MQRSHPDGLLESILNEWFDPLDKVLIRSDVESSGLSDAQVWQVFFANKAYCLKRWPGEQFSLQQLALWHRLLAHVHATGFKLIPLPTTSRNGTSVVIKNDDLWDLTSWLPGAPIKRKDCDELMLAEMLQSLAEFHRAVGSFQEPVVGYSPGLLKRREILQNLLAESANELQQALAAQKAHQWHDLLQQVFVEVSRVSPAILSRLSSIANQKLPLQWCLRDVKYDHMLLEGKRVSGMVDYGAAAIDSVACDIARLTGSIFGDQIRDWKSMLATYESHCSLTPDERTAVPLFHAGGTVAAAANWLRWLLLEKRNFGKVENVQHQLEWLLACLKNLP